jgi:AraC-like DNA-binding protein
VLGEHLIGPAADRPALQDRSIRQQVSDLHAALACPDEGFEAETRLAFVAERVRRLLGERGPEPAPVPSRELAERLRAFLDAHAFEPVTMSAAASELASGPTQLARAFSSVFGIAPHVYLVGRRLDAARDRILAGQPLADVAADVGFYDQAHLSRRFKRFLGTTPGHFGPEPRRIATPARPRSRSMR